MPVDHSLMKLGRLPARIDPRVPRFSRYLTTKLPFTPPVADWSLKVTQLGMLANDRIGDCTAAGCAHAVQVWTANASKEVAFSDEDVIHFYSETCGYDPANPDSDRGGVEVDVLSWWLKNDLVGHKLDAFASVDVGNRTNIKDSIWLTGGVYLGVNLPVSAQTQEVWDLSPEGLAGDGKPGSWGGHCVYALTYDAKGLTVITWGQLKRMTWEFFDAYTEEAYALLSKEWLQASGVSPSGFLYDDLIEDMKELGDGSPIDRLQQATDDPVLLDLKWHDVTISLHEASTTWAIGLLSAAVAAYGQFDPNAVTTWLGTAGALFSTWRYITRVHSMNVSTKVLVEAAADIIDIFMRKRAH